MTPRKKEPKHILRFEPWSLLFDVDDFTHELIGPKQIAFT
jgi:hypothetical protein